MSTVTVYFAANNHRSRLLGDAAYKGLRAIGETARLMDSRLYREVRSDYAVFYGLSDGLDQIFSDYKEQATAVYLDLGYWHRRQGGRFNGYHKVVVNSRHPTAYFQNREHNSSRFDKLGLKVEPWKKDGRHIVIAGMSAKAAEAEGIEYMQWEKGVAAHLKSITDRPIVYRPKPSDRAARPIAGIEYNKQTSLEGMFNGCHAVVARQSNVGVDALLAGVPVFCEYGVASVLARSDLNLIDNLWYAEGRQRWANDIAWCQFTTAEIARGIPFRHLKEEGLIP